MHKECSARHSATCKPGDERRDTETTALNNSVTRRQRGNWMGIRVGSSPLLPPARNPARSSRGFLRNVRVELGESGSGFVASVMKHFDHYRFLDAYSGGSLFECRAGTPAILTEIFRGFRPFLQANAGTVLRLGHGRFVPDFSINDSSKLYSLASLNKRQISILGSHAVSSSIKVTKFRSNFLPLFSE